MSSSRLRRILMTVDTVGGVWTYAMDLAKGLAETGIEIVLASMGEPLSDDQRTMVSQLGNVRLFESRYKLEWMQDPWLDVEKAGRWLLEIAGDCKPDLVHLNGFVHGCLPWKVPVLAAGHSCVLSWWRAVESGPLPRCFSEYKTKVARGLRAVDMVIAPTDAMLSELTHFYGPFRSAGFIYNGREFSPDSCNCRKEDLVFTAGRLWDKAKNIAAVDVVAGELNWPVYSAGNNLNPDGGACRLRHATGIGILGPGEMNEWYARASIYTLPARYEPFGLSILEAAQRGCALVIGDISSLREIWEDAAVFVPPDDPVSLRRALDELILDTDKRKRLGMAARARAQKFSIRQMAGGYLDVYRTITGKAIAEASD